MAKWLVAFDTDKIKQYVFRTSTLKEIRGASALLDHLNRNEMPSLVGGELIYANGGGGLFVLDAPDAPLPGETLPLSIKAAIHRVQAAYLTATSSGSITGAAVPLPPTAQAQDERIQRALALLRYRLRAAKTTSSEPLVPVTHGLFRFCDVCGAEYAEEQQRDAQVCRSCAAKRRENDAVQASIRRWIGDPSTANQSRLWSRLIAELHARNYPLANHDRPETFEDLGATSRPGDYMGLIYADGDGMGRIIERINSTDQMRTFSQAVDRSLHEAVADAAARFLQPQPDGPLPFDVLLLGGDDLVMVTSAHKAIAAAAHIVETFAKLTARRWGAPLSLSASVTLTHTSYPIGPLIQLAESGLKFAKQEAALRRLGGGGPGEGLINFLVVNSPNHVEFRSYYNEVLRAKEDEDTVVLRTMRPYTAAEIQALLDKVRAAKKTPRAKLEQLRAAVFKSRRQATLDAMKATLRTRNESQRQALFALVGQTEQEQIHLPWIRRSDKLWETPVVDVVELLDFVESLSDDTDAGQLGG